MKRKEAGELITALSAGGVLMILAGFIYCLMQNTEGLILIGAGGVALSISIMFDEWATNHWHCDCCCNNRERSIH